MTTQQNKLTPEEIGHIYMLYHNANTVHVKHLNKPHAKRSLLKSYLGCSNYVRENFDWNKYRLVLSHIGSISEYEVYELAQIVAGLYDREFKFFNVVRTIYSMSYNIVGHTIVKLDFESCRLTIENKIDPWPTAFLDLGYQYLRNKGFALPVFFGVNHWANGKTPLELDVAVEAI